MRTEEQIRQHYDFLVRVAFLRGMSFGIGLGVIAATFGVVLVRLIVR